jgi:hypothetical protein
VSSQVKRIYPYETDSAIKIGAVPDNDPAIATSDTLVAIVHP